MLSYFATSECAHGYVVQRTRRTRNGSRRGRGFMPMPTCPPASWLHACTSRVGRAVCHGTDGLARARRQALPPRAQLPHANHDGRDYLDDRRFPPAEGCGVLVINAPDEHLLASCSSGSIARSSVSPTKPARVRRRPYRWPAARCRSIPTRGRGSKLKILVFN